MDNHIESQDVWEQLASGDLTLSDPDFKRDDWIQQECAEWGTHSDKRHGTNEPYIEPEPIGLDWSHETLLKCVQQKSRCHK